jgi:hypothetical protein
MIIFFMLLESRQTAVAVGSILCLVPYQLNLNQKWQNIKLVSV